MTTSLLSFDSCDAYTTIGDIKKDSLLIVPVSGTKVDPSAITKFEQVLARNAKNVARLKEYSDNDAVYALTKDLYSELSAYCRKSQ